MTLLCRTISHYNYGLGAEDKQLIELSTDDEEASDFEADNINPLLPHPTYAPCIRKSA